MVAAVADDWMRSAMRDGEVVAQMLLRLKEAKVTSPSVLANPAVAALRWGIRQPRSRSPRCDGVSQRKEVDSTKNSRCSPSTPLSWSGGCGDGSSSPSAYADGYEATSRQTSGSLAVGSRSKILITEDSTGSGSGSGSGSKRLRRKKTFAELKEEEGNLLKERICLKKEIASLRATFDEQGTENENLKRLKLDLKIVRQSEPSLAHHQPGLGSGGDDSATLDQTEEEEEEVAEKMTTDGSFLLPDLNMMPSEENGNDYCSSGIETLYGTRIR